MTAKYIHAVTVEGATRRALDSTDWHSQPVLYFVFQEPGKVTLQPTGLIEGATKAIDRQNPPESIGQLLDAMAWTGQMWGVAAIAPLSMVGLLLTHTGWEVRYHKDNTAEADQIESWARDKRLKQHPDRKPIRQAHAAIRGQKLLTIHQLKGEEPITVDMTGGIPTGLAHVAAAFVPEWEDYREDQ